METLKQQKLSGRERRVYNSWTAGCSRLSFPNHTEFSLSNYNSPLLPDPPGPYPPPPFGARCWWTAKKQKGPSRYQCRYGLDTISVCPSLDVRLATYPALRTAPVQLNEAAAPLLRNGEVVPLWCPPPPPPPCWTCSDSPPPPSPSSSLIAVVKESRSSSDICRKEQHFFKLLLKSKKIQILI